MSKNRKYFDLSGIANEFENDRIASSQQVYDISDIAEGAAATEKQPTDYVPSLTQEELDQYFGDTPTKKEQPEKLNALGSLLPEDVVTFNAKNKSDLPTPEQPGQIKEYKEPSFVDKTLTRIKEAGKNVAKSALETASSTSGGLKDLFDAVEYNPIIKSAIENLPGNEAAKVIAIGGKKLGDVLSDVSEKIKTNPTYEKEFLTTTLPQALGSQAVFMLSGGLGKLAGLPVGATTALTGAFAQLGSEYKNVKQKTSDPNKILATVLINGVIGTSEAAPISRLFNRMDGVSGGILGKEANKLLSKPILKMANAEGLEEFTQESLQNIATDITAEQLYDESRNWKKNLGQSVEQGAAGYIVGFLSMLVGAKLRQHGLKPKEKQALEEAAQNLTTSPIVEPQQIQISPDQLTEEGFTDFPEVNEETIKQPSPTQAREIIDLEPLLEVSETGKEESDAERIRSGAEAPGEETETLEEEAERLRVRDDEKSRLETGERERIPEGATQQEERDIEEEVVSDNYKKLNEFKINNAKTVSEINSEINDTYSHIQQIEEKNNPQIKTLEKGLSSIKGRDKLSQQKKKVIKDQIDQLKGEIELASTLRENKLLDAWLNYSDEVKDRARKAGITGEQDLEDIATEASMEVTERPGIERTWDMKVDDVINEVIDYYKEKIEPSSGIIGEQNGRAIKMKLPSGEEKIFVMGEGSHKEPMTMAYRYIVDDMVAKGVDEKTAMNEVEDFIAKAAVNDRMDIGDVKNGKFESSWTKPSTGIKPIKTVEQSSKVYTPAEYLSEVPTPEVIKLASEKFGGIKSLQKEFEKFYGNELAESEREKGILFETFARQYLADEALKNVDLTKTELPVPANETVPKPIEKIPEAPEVEQKPLGGKNNIEEVSNEFNGRFIVSEQNDGTYQAVDQITGNPVRIGGKVTDLKIVKDELKKYSKRHPEADYGFEQITEPTEAQKEAGNYKMEHVQKEGFEVSIENKAGSIRSGEDESGKKWSQEMKNDYGYLKGTVGKDKDHLDVFLNDDYKEDSPAYIVNQTKPDGKFDEHKIMFGFDNKKDALKSYLSNYEKGWKNYKSIVEMPMDEFKDWAKEKNKARVEAKEIPIEEKSKNEIIDVSNLLEEVPAEEENAFSTITPERKESRVRFYEVPPDRINVDLKSMQNRNKQYDETTYKSIRDDIKNGEFDLANIPPVMVYKDNAGKLWTLNHSRLKAYQDEKNAGNKDLRTIPVQEIKAKSLEEAGRLAKEKTNIGAKETSVERAKIYRRERDKGISENKIVQKAQQNEGKNNNHVLNVSYLNPNGKTVTAYNSIGENVSGASVMRDVADYIGEAKRRIKNLSSAHEDELFDWLYTNGAIKNFGNKLKFLDNIESFVEHASFNKNEPLGVGKNKVVRGSHTIEVDNKLSDARKRRTSIEKERKDFEEGRSSLPFGLTPKEYLSEFSQKIANIDKEIFDLAGERRKAVDSDKLQDDLFSQITEEIKDEPEIQSESTEEIIGSGEVGKLQELAEDITGEAESEEQTQLNEAVRKADELIELDLSNQVLYQSIEDHPSNEYIPSVKKEKGAGVNLPEQKPQTPEGKENLSIFNAYKKQLNDRQLKGEINSRKKNSLLYKKRIGLGLSTAQIPPKTSNVPIKEARPQDFEKHGEYIVHTELPEIIKQLQQPIYEVRNWANEGGNPEVSYYGFNKKEAFRELEDSERVEGFENREQEVQLFEDTPEFDNKQLEELQSLYKTLTPDEFENRFPDKKSIADFIERKVGRNEIALDSRTIKPINETTDEILSNVQNKFGGKYPDVPIKFDKEGDPIEWMRIRIADHTGNYYSIGGDGERPELSIVIANKDATLKRFGRSEKEIPDEYRFDEDSTPEEIIDFINEKIAEKKNAVSSKEPTAKQFESKSQLPKTEPQKVADEIGSEIRTESTKGEAESQQPSRHKGKITKENYFYNTRGTWKRVATDKKAFEKFGELKTDSKAEYIQSPMLGSQYLIMGDRVYRLSDHWGKFASVDWALDKPMQNWEIGKGYTILAEIDFKDLKVRSEIKSAKETSESQEFSELTRTPEEGVQILKQDLFPERTELQSLQDKKRQLELAISEMQKMKEKGKGRFADTRDLVEQDYRNDYWESDQKEKQAEGELPPRLRDMISNYDYKISQAKKELKSVERKIEKLQRERRRTETLPNQQDMFGADELDIPEEFQDEFETEEAPTKNEKEQLTLFQKEHTRIRIVFEKMSAIEQRKFIDELLKGINPEWLTDERNLSKERAAGLTDLIKKSILYDPRTADITTAWEESLHASVVSLAKPYLARNVLRENGWNGKGEIWEVTNNLSLKNAHEKLAKKYIEWRTQQENNPSVPKTRTERLFQTLREFWAKITSYLNQLGFSTQSGYFYDLSTGKLRARAEEISSVDIQTEAVLAQKIKVTNAPEFKKWFGKSKVVNERGEPLILFHGTNKSFDKFNFRPGGARDVGFHFGTAEQANARVGTYNVFELAPGGENILPVYLSISNPVRINDVGRFNSPKNLAMELFREKVFADMDFNINQTNTRETLFNRIGMVEIANKLKGKGYDGIKYRNDYETRIARKLRPLELKIEDADYSWIAFDKTQIKSATGNQGTFNPNDPNILRQRLEKKFPEMAQALFQKLPLERIKESMEEKGREIFKSGKTKYAEWTKELRKEFGSDEDYRRLYTELLKEKGTGKEKPYSSIVEGEPSLLEKEVATREEQIAPPGKGHMVYIRERTLIKQKIAEFKKGYEAGNKETKKELEFLKKQISGYAREYLPGQLNKSEITPVMTQIARAGSIEDVEKAFDRIDTIVKNNNKNYLIKSIFNALQTFRPKKEKGILKGKHLTADEYALLGDIKSIIALKPAQVEQIIAEFMQRVDDNELEFDDQMDEFFYQVNLFGDLENKTPAQLRQALDELKEIISYGVSKRKAKREIAKEKRTAVTNQIIKEVTKGGRGILSEQDLRKLGEDNKKFYDYMSYMHNLESIFDAMTFDKSKGMYEGILNKYFIPKIKEAHRRQFAWENELQGMVRKELFNIYGIKEDEFAHSIKLARVLNKNKERIEKTGVFYVNPRTDNREELKLSQNEAAKKWMEYQDAKLQATFVKMGWDETTINQLEGFLTPEIKKWASFQLKEIYPKIGKDVNSIYREYFGVDMPSSDNYSPLTREYDKMLGEDGTVLLGGKTHYSSVVNGHLKARISNTRPLRFVDMDDALGQQIVQMGHFIAFADAVKDMRIILQNEEVQKAITQNHGYRYKKMLNNQINDLARGGSDRGLTINFLEKTLKRFVPAVLGLNPSITLKQLTSLPAYSGEIPRTAFIKGIGDFIANPIKAVRILSKTDYAQERYGKGFERDIITFLQKKTTGVFAGTKNIRDGLMILISLGDKGSTYFGGWSVYKYNYDKAIKEGKNIAEAKTLAETAFQTSTDRTQQSGETEDLSELQKMGTFGKMITLFMTQPASYFRQEWGAIRNITRGRGKLSENLYKVVLYHAVLPAIFQFVASGFPGLFSDWDEKDERRLLRAITLGSFNGLLIFGNMLEYFFNILNNEKLYGSSQIPLQQVPESMSVTIKKVKKIIETNRWQNMDMDTALETIDAVMQSADKLTGIPYYSGKRIYEGAKDISEGEGSPIKVLGYSDYALGNEKKSEGNSNKRINRMRPRRIPRSRSADR